MKAGILAAGSGTRFLQAGCKTPKPLIRLHGKPMIHHVLDNLRQAGAGTVDVLLNGNERFDVVESYLGTLGGGGEKIRVWRRTTRSSFETFRLLLQLLAPPPFVISTVDSILDPDDLKRFLAPGSYPEDCTLALAVTDYVRDDNPLWVALEEDGRVSAVGEDVSEGRYVTAGVYQVLGDLPAAASGEAFSALRRFLRHLVRSGSIVYGRAFRTALDLDDPQDVLEGERLLGDAAEVPVKQIFL